MYLARRFFEPPVAGGAGIAVSGVGIRETMGNHGYVDRPRKPDYLCMFFHGQGRVRLPQGWEDCTNQLMIWDVSTHQAYGNALGGWNHSWMHLEGDYFASKMAALGIPFNRPCCCTGMEDWFTDALQVIFRECCEAAPIAGIIRSVLDVFLLRLARGLHANTPQIPRQICQAKALLDTRFADEWTLASLAQKVGVSASFLSGQFSHFVGTSPMRYLRRLRMDQAVLLLYNRDLRIGDVAFSVGYKDIFHFSKSFKQTFGMSPSTYIKTQKRL